MTRVVTGAVVMGALAVGTAGAVSLASAISSSLPEPPEPTSQATPVARAATPAAAPTVVTWRDCVAPAVLEGDVCVTHLPGGTVPAAGIGESPAAPPSFRTADSSPSLDASPPPTPAPRRTSSATATLDSPPRRSSAPASPAPPTHRPTSDDRREPQDDDSAQHDETHEHHDSDDRREAPDGERGADD